MEGTFPQYEGNAADHVQVAHVDHLLEQRGGISFQLAVEGDPDRFVPAEGCDGPFVLEFEFFHFGAADGRDQIVRQRLRLLERGLERLALASDKVQRALDGAEVRKVIVVPDRLVNLVA